MVPDHFLPTCLRISASRLTPWYVLWQFRCISFHATISASYAMAPSAFPLERVLHRRSNPVRTLLHTRCMCVWGPMTTTSFWSFLGTYMNLLFSRFQGLQLSVWMFPFQLKHARNELQLSTRICLFLKRLLSMGKTFSQTVLVAWLCLWKTGFP